MITTTQLNEKLLQAEYAVRGPIVQRAQELEAQGKKIIYCNIGNPQALKQRPLTYMRQLLCLLEYPELLNHGDVARALPQGHRRAGEVRPREARPRHRRLHPERRASPSSARRSPTSSRAATASRRTRARIILTDGASKGAQAVLTALLRIAAGRLHDPDPAVPALQRQPDALSAGSGSATSSTSGTTGSSARRSSPRASRARSRPGSTPSASSSSIRATRPARCCPARTSR